MFHALASWLEHRIGHRKLMSALLLEHLPGGAKWRYVWGSALAFVFMIQLVTGLLLMLQYSPGDSTAWGSVYFIQYEMDFGWLIRGLHHFGSQTMVVLLALHILQVVIAGAQLPPREFTWWFGLGLMVIVLGLSLTGYLLPWDQKGYYATTVVTNIVSGIPLIGTYLQTIVVGGPEYGNHTLTHFYTLHVGILPAALVLLLIAHLAGFRRHGVTAPANAQEVEYFWPGQAFRDLAAGLIVFAVMIVLVVFAGHGNKIDSGNRETPSLYEDWAKAGQKGWGANLDAPADRETQGYPARPEWYFLFLFQLLKYFEGESMLIGTTIIPIGVMVVLMVLPLLGYRRMRKFGQAVGVFVVVALLGSVATLTFLAILDDAAEPFLGCQAGEPIFGWGQSDPKKAKEAKKRAQDFQQATQEASKEARRAVNLAHFGIPEGGARELLRKDPQTQGPRLFQKNCAVCHAYSPEPDAAGKNTASNLSGFGTEKWIRGLLEKPSSPDFLGPSGDMSAWRAEIDELRKSYDAKQIMEQDEGLDLIARFVADQARPERNAELNAKNSKAHTLFTDKKIFRCADCHQLQGTGEVSLGRDPTRGPKKGRIAPDLTNYGSPEWIRFIIMSPSHPSLYGKFNQMPAFRPKDAPIADVPLREFLYALKQANLKTEVIELSDIDRELIIRWMTGHNRVVFGGQPIAGAK